MRDYEFLAVKNVDTFLVKMYNGTRLRGCMNLAKLGRKKSEEPRDNKVTVRFTEKEYQKLKECSARHNLTIAKMIRKSVHETLDI